MCSNVQQRQAGMKECTSTDRTRGTCMLWHTLMYADVVPGTAPFTTHVLPGVSLGERS